MHIHIHNTWHIHIYCWQCQPIKSPGLWNDGKGKYRFVSADSCYFLSFAGDQHWTYIGYIKLAIFERKKAALFKSGNYNNTSVTSTHFNLKPPKLCKPPSLYFLNHQHLTLILFTFSLLHFILPDKNTFYPFTNLLVIKKNSMFSLKQNTIIVHLDAP